MAMHEITTGNDTSTAPVACALTSADLAAQAGRLQQLAAWAMTDRTETAEGLRIWFRPEPGVEDELHKLIAVENECCPWATWTVQRAVHHVVLEVLSAGEGIATLHSMLTGLQATWAPAAAETPPAWHL
jgi:hypothetical protein